MGPGCFHPRNEEILTAAETTIQLQWGRDVSIPEIPGLGSVTNAFAPASMGPGCFHPRNPDERIRSGTFLLRFNGAGMFPSQKCAGDDAAQVYCAVLQWGRDVSIPEMVPGHTAWSGGAEASMGPGCFHPRNRQSRRRRVDAEHASMGPGCFHPRNLLRHERLDGRQPASMGPGCFHPRNLPRQCRVPARRHSFNGAGMFPSQKSPSPS